VAQSAPGSKRTVITITITTVASGNGNAMMFSLMLFAAAAASDAVVIDRIVAVINNDVVLQSEMDSVIEPRVQQLPQGIDKAAWVKQAQTQVLETLIAEKLLEGEMRKLRIDVTEDEVQRLVEGTMSDNNLTEEQFRQALQAQRMSLEDFRDNMKKQLMKMKVLQLKVKSRVNISDDDVKTAEKATPDASQMRVRARHVLVLVGKDSDGTAEKKRIDAAAAELAAGAAFEDVAKKHSDDAGSRERGGLLGEFGRGDMVPEFEKAAYALEVGRVSAPVRSPFGWHLIRVDERVQAAKTDNAGTEQVRQKLYEQEVERQFLSYIEELKAAAFIERRLPR
jgi:peptidyl-prolyl cis-trans isomerase SurA